MNAEQLPPHALAPADVQLLGFPGPFTDWGVALVRAALEAAGQTVATLGVGSAPSAAPAGTTRLWVGHGPIYQPPSSTLPTIVFLDNPADALERLIADPAGTHKLLGAMTQTLAPLGAVLRKPDTLLIRPADAASAASRIADAIVPGAEPTAPSPPPPAAACGTLPDLARITVDALLAPMLETVVSGTRQSFALPRECLMWQPNEPAPAVVDLTGPARPVFFGPYFQFLPGWWQVEIDLFFSNDVADASFAIEFFGEAIIKKIRFRPKRGGLFRASFTVNIEDPQIGMELRVWVERGTIEGWLGINRITFQPSSPPG